MTTHPPSGHAAGGGINCSQYAKQSVPIPNGLSHSRGPIVVSSVRPDIFMYQKFLTRGTRYQLSPVF